MKGKCAIESHAQNVHLTESYAALIPAGEWYSCHADCDGSLFARVKLDTGEYAERLTRKENFCAFRLEDSHSYYLLTQLISAAMQRHHPETLTDIRSALAGHLCSILPGRGEKGANGIAPVVELIHNNPLELYPLEDLADMVSLHPMTIAKKFRQQRGCSIGEFRQRVRAERAFFRVIKTSAPLSATSLTCGYADQSHMTRSFRRYFGYTPAGLRRVMRSSPHSHISDFLPA